MTKPGIAAGLQLELTALARGSACDLQVDSLGALAAAVRLRVEANLLILRQSGQARSLNGRNVYKDVRAALVRLDKAKTFVGVEEFYCASLGHASGPFISARHPHGQHH